MSLKSLFSAVYITKSAAVSFWVEIVVVTISPPNFVCDYTRWLSGEGWGPLTFNRGVARPADDWKQTRERTQTHTPLVNQPAAHIRHQRALTPAQRDDPLVGKGPLPSINSSCPMSLSLLILTSVALLSLWKRNFQSLWLSHFASCQRCGSLFSPYSSPSIISYNERAQLGQYRKNIGLTRKYPAH
ncbi:hypothetical protein Ddc_00521 [Ditylenchus destructor]|nr:hypothetical protein Ddc_00521 [Ditylenchus destructor]